MLGGMELDCLRRGIQIRIIKMKQMNSVNALFWSGTNEITALKGLCAHKWYSIDKNVILLLQWDIFRVSIDVEITTKCC